MFNLIYINMYMCVCVYFYFIYIYFTYIFILERCWWPLTLVSVQPFGNILNLVPLAESVVKLNAVCMQCFKEAAYTKRLGAEKEVRTETAELTSGQTHPLIWAGLTRVLLSQQKRSASHPHPVRRTEISQHLLFSCLCFTSSGGGDRRRWYVSRCVSDVLRRSYGV